MSADRPEARAARFRPHAARDMAEMFDDVSPRYDLLNAILSLGRDATWRRAMAHAVPEEARAVLDLCTGNGISLEGLRRPGRLVVGVDVSLGMLRAAAEAMRQTGWAPRLVGADAFHLPLKSGSLAAVTIAFGIRNLRPPAEAMAELARVLEPGGRLVVLEATGPAPGPLAPFHRFYLERVVPLAGRISHDPSAYRYLGASILAFGTGSDFEAGLAGAGFAVERRRVFMMGAARLWVARREVPVGQIASISPAGLQDATAPTPPATPGDSLRAEWRAWTGVQALISASLLAVLVYAGRAFAISGADLPLEEWQRRAGWVLIVVAILGFAARTVILVARLLGGRSRL